MDYKKLSRVTDSIKKVGDSHITDSRIQDSSLPKEALAALRKLKKLSDEGADVYTKFEGLEDLCEKAGLSLQSDYEVYWYPDGPNGDIEYLCGFESLCDESMKNLIRCSEYFFSEESSKFNDSALQDIEASLNKVLASKIEEHPELKDDVFISVENEGNRVRVRISAQDSSADADVIYDVLSEVAHELVEGSLSKKYPWGWWGDDYDSLMQSFTIFSSEDIEDSKKPRHKGKSAKKVGDSKKSSNYVKAYEVTSDEEIQKKFGFIDSFFPDDAPLESVDWVGEVVKPVFAVMGPTTLWLSEDESKIDNTPDGEDTWDKTHLEPGFNLSYDAWGDDGEWIRPGEPAYDFIKKLIEGGFLVPTSMGDVQVLK